MADVPSSADASHEWLRQRLRRHPRLAQLSQATQDEIARRIVAAAPYRNLADLTRSVSKLRIANVKRQDREAVLEVLRGAEGTRRQWIACCGLSGLVAGAYGTWQLTSQPDKMPARPDRGIRPLIAALQQAQTTAGAALVYRLQASPGSKRATPGTQTDALRHALDMSNWLEAALLLDNAAVRSELASLIDDPAFGVLLGALEQLRGAWQQLLAVRETWRQEYFLAYAFGKLPALASATPAEAPFDAAKTLRNLGPLFHALEILNQRFLPEAFTRWGAPVRVTQGHNVSYAHLANDLSQSERFDPARPTVLVNCDAHADLSPPFENSRMPLANPMAMLASARTFAERVVVAGSMSIAGWILPLLQQGVLQQGEQPAEMLWVVPPEAAKTSTGYMPPYGTYELFVGRTTAADGEKSGLRVYSHEERLSQVASPQRLSDGRACTLSIVSTDDLEHVDSLVRDKQIALSIDVDFAGTREPGVSPRRGFLPHYPLNETPQQRARHHALIHQAGVFFGRWQRTIRSVTIANSPNFTADEATRHPLAHMLEELAEAGLAKTPTWLQGELRREAPPSDDLALWINRGLAVGGWASVAAAAGMAGRQWQESRTLARLLFEETT